MYHVYILQSLKSGRYYVGSCEDIQVRLKRHNDALVRSTKVYIPWTVVYSEEYETRSGAYRREVEIKKYKGGIKFKKLLGLFKE